MDRRTFSAGLALALLAARDARAQERRPARLVFVRMSPPIQDNVAALEAGLRDRGYVVGRDVVIEYRDAGGQPERLPRLVGDVVAAKFDLIFVSGAVVAQAFSRATSTIPIVLTAAGDPLALGLVSSLSRPGGNVTGNSIVNVTMAPKRVELLQQLVPRLARVAVLNNVANPALAIEWNATRDASAAIGIEATRFDVNGSPSYDNAFRRMLAQRAQAAVVLEDPTFSNDRRLIVELAARSRLPVVYGHRSFAEAGGLVSHGPSFIDLYRNAAGFADKILRGAKASDLPIEQPATFELVVNLRTATALGLTVPRSVLLRATEVIS